MNKKVIKWLKLSVVFAIIIAFLWFLVLSPIITFRNNEKKVEKAARRYFELNSNLLPTGERVRTLPLSTLYHKAFLEGDVYSPYSKKVCSGDNSWVKVKRVDNDYKYYIYLDCGLMKSKVDHEGPNIKLKGDSELTINLNSEYKESGVSSVIDKVDGKIAVDKVKISGSVDTSKVGTYEIKYEVSDSLSNKTTVIRKITVVRKFNETIKQVLEKANNFIGEPNNNYVMLSNIMYRIYGFDADNNVIVISDDVISSVSYSKLEKWLDYFESNIGDEAKKLLVKSKFCNMGINSKSLDTTQCTGYTSKRYSFIPSIIEINRSMDASNTSFIRPDALMWTANYNADNKKIAYTTRSMFYGDEYGKIYSEDSIDYNYGVKPMLVIKGSALIKSGDGTYNNPYSFGDVHKAKGGDYLNTRYSGEFFVDSTGMLWRIIGIEDGYAKAITYTSVGNDIEEFTIYSESNVYIYDPTEKRSYAYYITNRSSQYLDTSFLQVHDFEVPIYKNKVLYGSEIETRKVKAKYAAPNIFELFSAQTEGSRSFWYINSSKKEGIATALMDIGVPTNEEIPDYWRFGVRLVGYVKSKCVISSGDGTISSPYKIN